MRKSTNFFKSFFSGWRSGATLDRQQPADSKGEKRSYGYNNLHLLAGPSLSGANVNPETALSHATVYSCVKVIAESMASLPIGLYRRLPSGGSEMVPNRPEHRLMSLSPNENITSYKFRETAQIHLGLRGNTYARIIRDGRGTARELIPLHPDCVRPFFYKNRLYYDVSPNEYGGYDHPAETLAATDILHVFGMSTDGFRGRTPIQVLRETIGNGLTGRDFASRNLGEGSLRSVLLHKEKLGPDQVQSIRDNFRDAMQTGRIPLLENGVEFKSIAMTPADADYINQAKLNRQEIAGAHRVPLHMIGDLDRATFTNIEHQSLEFGKYCLLPWIKNWEEELSRKLIPYQMQGEYFYRYNMEGLLRADLITRMRSYSTAIQWGILNRDEVRDLENRNPIPDGLGQEFLTPMNMTSLTDAAAAAEDLANAGQNKDKPQ